MSSQMFGIKAEETGEEAVAPAALFGGGFSSGELTTANPDLLYTNAVRNDSVDADADNTLSF